MRLTRRDFLQVIGGLGITIALPKGLIQKAMAGTGDPRVIWLSGQMCTGCSVSLLNSVNLATIDQVLIDTIDLDYHSTLIASAGDLAFSSAIGVHPSMSELAAFSGDWLSKSDSDFDINGDGVVNFIDYAKLAAQGYILVVEGSIPTGASGKFCGVGGEMTMLKAFDVLSANATYIIAYGTCAAFGGISAAQPNPTGAVSVSAALSSLGRTKSLINIPGCPSHPDWFVGTLISLLAGQKVALDSSKRPTAYFSRTVHSQCPLRETEEANRLGDPGCMEEIGCNGPATYADCPIRKWNSPAKGQTGVNWCIGARTPCLGCTQPNFPDGMTPFHTTEEDD